MGQRRTRRLVVGALAVALPLAGLALAPAQADQQELQTLSEDQPIVEREFPPILAADPVTVTAGAPLTPDDCALSPTCHAIPVDIVVPELGEGDDFLVNASIAFDAPSGAEDVDVYFWDDQQTNEATGSSGYTEVSNAASAENPESFSVFNPTLGRYNFTVNNFSGVAVTYRLSMDIQVLDFERPIESLAPTANRGGGGSVPPGSSRPPSSPVLPRPAPTPVTPGAGSPTPGPSPVVPGVTPTTTAGLASGELPADADFSSGAFADETAFEDELAAPAIPEPTDLTGFGREDAPSGAALLLWLVALPIVLVVAGGGLLVRRDPAALRALLPGRRRAAATAEP